MPGSAACRRRTLCSSTSHGPRLPPSAPANQQRRSHCIAARYCSCLASSNWRATCREKVIRPLASKQPPNPRHRRGVRERAGDLNDSGSMLPLRIRLRLLLPVPQRSSFECDDA
eukprot:scpid31588/ scgid35340/ 